MPNELENVETLLTSVVDYGGGLGTFSRLEEFLIVASLQETTTIKTI